MKFKKYWWFGIPLIIILIWLIYYLISPLFIVEELHEDLMNKQEIERMIIMDNYYSITPLYVKYKVSVSMFNSSYSSNNTKIYTKEELYALLDKNNLL